MDTKLQLEEITGKINTATSKILATLDSLDANLANKTYEIPAEEELNKIRSNFEDLQLSNKEGALKELGNWMKMRKNHYHEDDQEFIKIIENSHRSFADSLTPTLQGLFKEMNSYEGKLHQALDDVNALSLKLFEFYEATHSHETEDIKFPDLVLADKAVEGQLSSYSRETLIEQLGMMQKREKFFLEILESLQLTVKKVQADLETAMAREKEINNALVATQASLDKMTEKSLELEKTVNIYQKQEEERIAALTRLAIKDHEPFMVGQVFKFPEISICEEINSFEIPFEEIEHAYETKNEEIFTFATERQENEAQTDKIEILDPNSVEYNNYQMYLENKTMNNSTVSRNYPTNTQRGIIDPEDEEELQTQQLSSDNNNKHQNSQIKPSSSSGSNKLRLHKNNNTSSNKGRQRPEPVKTNNSHPPPRQKQVSQQSSKSSIRLTPQSSKSSIKLNPSNSKGSIKLTPQSSKSSVRLSPSNSKSSIHMDVEQQQADSPLAFQEMQNDEQYYEEQYNENNENYNENADNNYNENHENYHENAEEENYYENNENVEEENYNEENNEGNYQSAVEYSVETTEDVGDAGSPTIQYSHLSSESPTGEKIYTTICNSHFVELHIPVVSEPDYYPDGPRSARRARRSSAYQSSGNPSRNTSAVASKNNIILENIMEENSFEDKSPVPPNVSKKLGYDRLRSNNNNNNNNGNIHGVYDEYTTDNSFASSEASLESQRNVQSQQDLIKIHKDDVVVEPRSFEAEDVHEALKYNQEVEEIDSHRPQTMRQPLGRPLVRYGYEVKNDQSTTEEGQNGEQRPVKVVRSPIMDYWRRQQTSKWTVGRPYYSAAFRARMARIAAMRSGYTGKSSFHFNVVSFGNTGRQSTDQLPSLRKEEPSMRQNNFNYVRPRVMGSDMPIRGLSLIVQSARTMSRK